MAVFALRLPYMYVAAVLLLDKYAYPFVDYGRSVGEQINPLIFFRQIHKKNPS